MGIMRRTKRKNDASNVEKFLDDLRQEMGNNAPLPPSPKGGPSVTWRDFVRSVAFLSGWVLAGSVIIGLALRVVLFVAGV